MKVYRDRSQIGLDIFHTIQKNKVRKKGTTITNIVQGANLNYRQAKRHVQYHINNGCLEEKHVTENGRELTVYDVTIPGAEYFKAIGFLSQLK